jgi:hypothetical protein
MKLRAVKRQAEPAPKPLAEELLELLPHFTADERAAINELLTAHAPLWVPQLGPQNAALLTPADILFYGGQAGGGKTDLLLGNALQYQQHSIIFRREAVQLTGIEERMTAILGSRKGYNSQDGVWRLPGDRVLELGSVKEPGDWVKYQGRPHDFKGFDEICHFLESQFRALIGWLRTDNPTVRQRVIAAGNPPTDSDGEWVERYWGAWLELNHPNPAKPGELRWYITDDEGEDIEVPGPAPVKIKGRQVKPKSRTFIPSSVTDNLYLLKTGYADTLMALPEPLRSMMAEGKFGAGKTDHIWQIIPTSWVDAAMARWTPRPQGKGPMTRLGFDVARGGNDKSTVARRHDRWIDELIGCPGVMTNDGPKAAAFVAPLLRDRAPVSADAIGVGSSAVDYMRGLGMRVSAVVVSEGTTERTKAGDLFFKNKRALLYWRLREALDPNQDNPLALPPDKELRQELIAHRYKVVQMGNARAGILVRDKDEVREVLGRSPDKADAVVLTEDTAMPAGSADEAAAFRKLRGL